MPSLKVNIAALALAAALLPVSASADIFKYVDEGGVVYFSNVPKNLEPSAVIRESQPKDPKYNPAYKVSKKKKPKAEATATADTSKAQCASYTPGAAPLGDDVPYCDIINSKCDKYGVDPSLVKAVIKAESNFNPQAVSPKGAKGLMQLIPSTANDMGVSDVFDPDQNIDGGVKYLSYLLGLFGGDRELSVAAYNCGQGRVIRSGNSVPEIAETKSYVKKVLKLSADPITGKAYSKAIYKVELKDGSILFTDNPVGPSPGGVSFSN